MTLPRSKLVSVSDTPYYHCTSRCVRRAFLCGDDTYTGKSFEHRRAWFIERLTTLTQVFTIDVAAYAVMSNHCHLVVHIDANAAAVLSRDEVIDRWRQLYRGPEVIQRYCDGDTLSSSEQGTVSTIVACWRERLADLSWFMRSLNEYIARRANAEDGCTGRFWEGRFKSQALLDDTALLTALAYVDLNPVRAGIANDIPSSDKTSVQQRVVAIKDRKTQTPFPLQAFIGEDNSTSIRLPFHLQDYLALVDWTGRYVRADKRGVIDPSTPRILVTLGIDTDEWLPNVTEMQSRYELVMGAPDKMKLHAEARGRHFYRGVRYAARLYRRMVA